MQWSWMIVGAVFVAISLPLVKRRVPPNPWYGMRVPKTLANERIWYEANHVSGRNLLAAGMAIVLSAAITSILSPSLSDATAGRINFAVFLLSLSLATYFSFRAVRRMS